VLFDTGIRPDECHSLRWDNFNWDGGRNGTVPVATGKTKAARRVLPMSLRVRRVLENRWKLDREPGEGWVWPAETTAGHINHDNLKLRHKKALKAATTATLQL
jgi:integrase